MGSKFFCVNRISSKHAKKIISYSLLNAEPGLNCTAGIIATIHKTEVMHHQQCTLTKLHNLQVVFLQRLEFLPKPIRLVMLTRLIDLIKEVGKVSKNTRAILLNLNQIARGVCSDHRQLFQSNFCFNWPKMSQGYDEDESGQTKSQSYKNI